MIKIILKCATHFTTRIEFVYSNSQTFGYCYSCSTYVKNFTLDFSNKELFSIGFSAGGVIDTLEICARDLNNSLITCMKGCDTGRPITSKFYFTNFNIVSFIGSFNSNFNSLVQFGVQYVVIN